MKCYQWFGRWRDAGVPLGVWILIAACPIPALALTQGELDASRNLWNMSGSTDYDYFMQRSCFCQEDFIRPGLVQVRSEVITAVTDAETLQPLDPQLFLTVDGLFDELQAAIDIPAFDIRAQFESTYGYPTSFSIDFVENIADDEVAYTARELRIVPEPTSFPLSLLGVAVIACWRRGGRQRRELVNRPAVSTAI